MPRKLTRQTIEAALPHLSPAELQTLQSEIDQLLSAPIHPSRDTSPKPRKRTRKPSVGTQWVEYKHIRGYGPYAYLRTVESDGRVSSHYLGKQRQETGDSEQA